jgi:NAD(P)-dependent dehydrogenase (short-subunit alcohol dehydrogenase family)
LAVSTFVVKNTGIGDPNDGPPSTANLDAVERVLRNNFLGALTVTQAMPALLRQSGAGRFVNVSSCLGSLTRNGDSDYPSANTKLSKPGARCSIGSC